MLELDHARKLLGKEHRAGPFPVTRQLIDEYCAVLGETSPLYTDEAAARQAGYESVLAPPALCVLFANRASLPGVIIPDVRSSGAVAGLVVEPFVTVQAGDFLTASSRLKEVYPKKGRRGTTMFIIWETFLSNQREERVARVETSFAVQG